ncbi:DUF6333 family protein [Streptomyces sp. NPDC048650]|uniref:DUF6333 family protein n=1 Tax=unclassified Streptomyces TaxID=2593676 RepID=UPI00371E41C0
MRPYRHIPPVSSLRARVAFRDASVRASLRGSVRAGRGRGREVGAGRGPGRATLQWTQIVESLGTVEKVLEQLPDRSWEDLPEPEVRADLDLVAVGCWGRLVRIVDPALGSSFTVLAMRRGSTSTRSPADAGGGNSATSPSADRRSHVARRRECRRLAGATTWAPAVVARRGPGMREGRARYSLSMT